MRHASFFSGAGGLDLGFHNSGIETVSLSEIDPYASAVLAERFIGVPNLGNILEVKADDIPAAEIWSGGFPCQDLSVAGKRAGFAGKRSSLAFTFLDLVEQRKPRWLLLENVPGLFSSNGGSDFGRLISEMVSLGYGISWRLLDARYFGVAQRRRRIFIVAASSNAFGSDAAERAAEVCFECQGGCGHIEASDKEEAQASGNANSGSGIANALTSRFGKGVNSTVDEPLFIGQAVDPSGMRAADGLARWVDNSESLEAQMRVGNFELFSFPNEPLAQSLNTLRAGDSIAYNFHTAVTESDDLLPEGLDGHRYRCCGNGVVAPVAEWIGRRILAVDAKHYQAGA